jgi:hypothetical protein
MKADFDRIMRQRKVVLTDKATVQQLGSTRHVPLVRINGKTLMAIVEGNRHERRTEIKRLRKMVAKPRVKREEQARAK